MSHPVGGALGRALGLQGRSVGLQGLAFQGITLFGKV